MQVVIGWLLVGMVAAMAAAAAGDWRTGRVPVAAAGWVAMAVAAGAGLAAMTVAGWVVAAWVVAGASGAFLAARPVRMARADWVVCLSLGAAFGPAGWAVGWLARQNRRDRLAPAWVVPVLAGMVAGALAADPRLGLALGAAAALGAGVGLGHATTARRWPELRLGWPGCRTPGALAKQNWRFLETLAAYLVAAGELPAAEVPTALACGGRDWRRVQVPVWVSGLSVSQSWRAALAAAPPTSVDAARKGAEFVGLPIRRRGRPRRERHASDRHKLECQCGACVALRY